MHRKIKRSSISSRLHPCSPRLATVGQGREEADEGVPSVIGHPVTSS